MSNPNDSTDPIDVDELVSTLNDLLAKLHIPIPIDTPLDLTPFLLLGILESILQSRLPISTAIRKSRDPLSKVQAMKIFLGVLENDVLGEDVGLSDVDPRKLAEGEWDEVVFVGELLCWLGKKYGIIPVNTVNSQASSIRQQEELLDASIFMHTNPVDVRAHTPSPTTHSTATTTRDSMNTTLSMMRAAPPQSDTTLLSLRPDSPSLSVLDLFNSDASPVLEQMSRMRLSTVTPPPRTRSLAQTRDVSLDEGPSFMDLVGHSTPPRHDRDPDVTAQPQIAAGSFCHCPSDEEQEEEVEEETTPTRAKRATPVRYTGWISEVDEELEIRSFEESRRKIPTHVTRASSLLTRSTQSDPDRRSKADLYTGISSTSTPRKPTTRKSPASGYKTPTGPILTRHTSPSEYTLALFNERAKLMAELASVRSLPRHRLSQR